MASPTVEERKLLPTFLLCHLRIFSGLHNYTQSHPQSAESHTRAPQNESTTFRNLWDVIMEMNDSTNFKTVRGMLSSHRGGPGQVYVPEICLDPNARSPAPSIFIFQQISRMISQGLSSWANWDTHCFRSWLGAGALATDLHRSAGSQLCCSLRGSSYATLPDGTRQVEFRNDGNRYPRVISLKITHFKEVHRTLMGNFPVRKRFNYWRLHKDQLACWMLDSFGWGVFSWGIWGTLFVLGSWPWLMAKHGEAPKIPLVDGVRLIGIHHKIKFPTSRLLTFIAWWLYGASTNPSSFKPYCHSMCRQTSSVNGADDDIIRFWIQISFRVSGWLRPRKTGSQGKNGTTFGLTEDISDKP